MKKIMMIAAMMVAVLSANAQNEVGQVTLKPMVGLNLASLTKADDSKIRVGLAAGVEAEYGVAENFGITAGLIYSMQGVKGKDEISGVKVDETIKLDYINIPILANYYVTKGLAIKAGIQPAFKVNAKLKAEAGGVTAEEKIDNAKGFDFSIPVGISYEYESFVLDARYNFGLTKWMDGLDSKNSVFMISLGYKFSL